MIQTILPRDEKHWLELRSKNVNSTEVAALFGLSPYTTVFELHYIKKDGVIVDFDENDRVVWGKRLQDAIAEGVAKDNGWRIRRMDEYMWDTEKKMGSSFDFEILPVCNKCDHHMEDHGSEGCELEECHCLAFDEKLETNGILEIKNVDSLQFKNGWAIDGDDIEAPAHIELQVQQQLAVSGKAFAYLCALVGGNRVVLIRRDRDEKIIASIMKRVAEFWSGVTSGLQPAPDFVRDAEFISRLYGFAEPGKVLDVSGNEYFETLVAKYKKLGEEEKKASEQKAGVKAELLMMMGDAEKATAAGFTVSAGVTGPALVPAYERAGYRSFRVFLKKEKKS